MERKLASVRRIKDIRPIENADKIVVAQVDGWECVVKKDEFQIGDQIVYIEVDSVVPETKDFEFLRDRKFRVKAIKLRGQVSMGLVLPMSILPPGEYEDGADVTEILGVKKYDPEAQQEASMIQGLSGEPKGRIAKFMTRFAWYRKHFHSRARRKETFPDWIVKTDETRIQNMPRLFEAERSNGTEFSVTEKIDGQSATYYLRRVSRRRYEFGVCSRNIHLVTPDDSPYWAVARMYGMEKILKQLIGENESVVLQGEICGNGIQKNKYGIHGYELFVFNLIYPGRKCPTAEISNLVAPLGLRTVPVVEEGKRLPETIADLVEYSKGNSAVKKEQEREGIVMRNVERGISFKVLNPDFLLTEGD